MMYINRQRKQRMLTQQQRNNGRKRANNQQLAYLRRMFEQNPKPDQRAREEIGRRIDMTPRSVQIWFQNNRAKRKIQERTSMLPSVITRCNENISRVHVDYQPSNLSGHSCRYGTYYDSPKRTCSVDELNFVLKPHARKPNESLPWNSNRALHSEPSLLPYFRLGTPNEFYYGDSRADTPLSALSGSSTDSEYLFQSPALWPDSGESHSESIPQIGDQEIYPNFQMQNTMSSRVTQDNQLSQSYQFVDQPFICRRDSLTASVTSEYTNLCDDQSPSMISAVSSIEENNPDNSLILSDDISKIDGFVTSSRVCENSEQAESTVGNIAPRFGSGVSRLACTSVRIGSWLGDSGALSNSIKVFLDEEKRTILISMTDIISNEVTLLEQQVREISPSLDATHLAVKVFGSPRFYQRSQDSNYYSDGNDFTMGQASNVRYFELDGMFGNLDRVWQPNLCAPMSLTTMGEDGLDHILDLGVLNDNGIEQFSQ